MERELTEACARLRKAMQATANRPAPRPQIAPKGKTLLTVYKR